MILLVLEISENRFFSQDHLLDIGLLVVFDEVTVAFERAGDERFILATMLSSDALTGIGSCCSLGICGALWRSFMELVSCIHCREIAQSRYVLMKLIGCMLYFIAFSFPSPALIESKNDNQADRESVDVNGQ